MIFLALVLGLGVVVALLTRHLFGSAVAGGRTAAA